MQTSHTYSHHHAEEDLAHKCLLEQVLSLADAPNLPVAPKSGKAIRAHIEDRLIQFGWAKEPDVDPDHDLTINAMKQRVGLTVQTGNIARAFYDLLKFQVMFQKDRLDVAVLMLPTQSAAATIGSNIANFTRVSNEIELFKHIITIPVFLISFE